jgi:hypothetical protein
VAGRRPTYRVQRQRRARARHGAASCCVPVPASAPVRGDRWSTGHGARGAVDGHELPPVGYLESPLHGHAGVGCHVRTNLAPCIVLFLFFVCVEGELLMLCRLPSYYSALFASIGGRHVWNCEPNAAGRHCRRACVRMESVPITLQNLTDGDHISSTFFFLKTKIKLYSSDQRHVRLAGG